MLQGMFGAAIVPLSQATILDIFPSAQRGQAMAIWVLGVVVGPILGPTLGGYLTDFYNWRWVFYINLAVRRVGNWRAVAVSSRTTGQKKLNFISISSAFSALSIGLGALQLMLDRGEFKDWFGSTEIIVYCHTVWAWFLLVPCPPVHRQSAPYSTPHLFAT